HCGNTLRQKVQREVIRPVEESIKVLVVPAAAHPPVARGLTLRTSHVGGTGAGVVRTDLVAREAAKKLGDRLPARFAEDIPKGDVEGRVAACLRPGRPKSNVGRQVPCDAIDGER